MKWFRVMQCSNTVSKPLVCEVDNFDKYDNFGFGFRVERYFYQAERIANWPKDISFTTNKSRIKDFAHRYRYTTPSS